MQRNRRSARLMGPARRLDELNASRGGAAVPVCFHLEPDPLAMVEPCDTRALKGADVHHDFAGPAIRRNQAEALKIVENFNCATDQTHATTPEYHAALSVGVGSSGQ